MENGEMSWPTILALLVLFAGVAYWAFRPRWRKTPGPGQGRDRPSTGNPDDADGGGSSS